MDQKLTDLSVDKLLRKFGAGNHKPGSGSASAFQGMLSAKLILTVINLTERKNSKGNYTRHLPELLGIRKDIEEKIYPELERLFHEDALEFDKVIDLRRQRDDESDPFKKHAILEDLKNSLKKATEIPIDIAECCLQLADFSVATFDGGFQSARGDSGVALNGAIAAVVGCLNIIELNLISLPLTDWTTAIIRKKDAIKLRCNVVSSDSMNRLKVLEDEVREHLRFQEAVAEFQQGDLSNSIKSDADLERLVRKLQNALWINKDYIWKGNAPEYAMDVLKPETVLKKVLGYQYVEESTLGTHLVGSEHFEVAGLIDKSKKVVLLSKGFPDETRRFTAAHELGHAILHNQTILHRDRPIDGSSQAPRTPEETQANKFAALFLMPSSVVKEVVVDVFKTERFEINEGNVLALREGDIHSFRRRCQNLRGLSRRIAVADYFGGTSFNPLHKVFGVSVETMAIRLEELGFVNF